MLHDPFFLFGPVAVFGCMALIVALLTFGQSNFCFDVGAFPVNRSADAGVAFGLNFLVQTVDFTTMHQQLTFAPWLGNDMR